MKKLLPCVLICLVGCLLLAAWYAEFDPLAAVTGPSEEQARIDAAVARAKDWNRDQEATAADLAAGRLRLSEAIVRLRALDPRTAAGVSSRDADEQLGL